MKKNIRFHQLEEDTKREQLKIMCKDYIMWLHKKRAKPKKMFNQLFLLS